MPSALAPLDLANPVVRSHPQNRQLLGWWRSVPGLAGGALWHNLLDVGGLAARLHGRLTGMAPFTAVSGWGATNHPGGAGEVRFDGVDDFVPLGTSLIALNTPWSVSAWVKIADIASNAYTIMGPSYNDASHSYGIFMHRADKSGLTFQWTDTGTGAVWPATASRNLTANVWTHVALVANPLTSILDIYMDGQQVTHATSFAMAPANPTGQGWSIGAWGAAPTSLFWKGAIDDVRLSARALTPGDMQLLYQETCLGYPTLLRRVARHWVGAAMEEASLTLALVAEDATTAMAAHAETHLTLELVAEDATTAMQVAGSRHITVALVAEDATTTIAAHVEAHVTLALIAADATMVMEAHVEAHLTVALGAEDATTAIGLSALAPETPISAPSVGVATMGGFAREALVTAPTWPAAAPAVLTELLPLVSATITDGVSMDFGNSPSSPAGAQRGLVTRITPSAHIECDMRYSGLETLLCLALGAAPKRIGATVLPEPTSGAYRHIFEVAPCFGTSDLWTATDGVLGGDGLDANLRKVRRGTLALSRGVSVWEMLSCVVSQASFALTDEGNATCALDFNAYSLTRQPTVNTLATMRMLPPNAAPSVLDIDLRLRLGPASPTVPLDAGDELGVTAWSLTVQNYLTVEPGPRTGLYAEEIEKSAASGISGTFTLPRYQTNALIDAWPAGTLFMLEYRFEGPLIPGTAVPYSLTFALPAVQLTTALVPLPPGAAPVNIGWYASEPQAVAAGFALTSLPSPLVIELYTDKAEHPLLAA